jgi:hypothetical protein
MRISYALAVGNQLAPPFLAPIIGLPVASFLVIITLTPNLLTPPINNSSEYSILPPIWWLCDSLLSCSSSYRSHWLLFLYRNIMISSFIYKMAQIIHKTSAQEVCIALVGPYTQYAYFSIYTIMRRKLAASPLSSTFTYKIQPCQLFLKSKFTIIKLRF